VSAERFDAIVVGAGPAGSTAAWRLARAGRSVALLERGAQPGAKNLFGGMIYSLELARHFPHFVDAAPIERPVTRHATHLLGEGRSLNVDFACEPFGQAPYNGFTAYRSRFDRWLAGEAERAGALLVPSTVVDDLLIEQGRVVGVLARREAGELRAPVVICADGILSLLGQKAGLVRAQPPAHYSLGVRETLALPAGVIEDRFQVDASGGCAALFLGRWPGGLQGGGFAYTNRDTVSVGFVAQLPSLERAGVNILDALDAFKRQPAVRRLIQGGERLEYGAHVVPEGGWHMRPPLVRDGLMLAGDAGGMVLAAGILYEGVHYAMHSGLLAAETALEALEAGDFRAARLRRYEQRLDASYVMRNLKAFRHVPGLLTNPRMFAHYPDALCRVAEDFFRAEAGGHAKLGALLCRHVLRPVGLRAALSDAWGALRALVR
jgi:electron transfer flavoprotein-quinone oxidoreductase